jgi:molybdenum-dependent DNA-binding transcriptional regulator ModE
MNDKLLALRLFVRVARTGSFSAAARELDLSQPSVSRIIAALEEEVGAALVMHFIKVCTCGRKHSLAATSSRYR